MKSNRSQNTKYKPKLVLCLDFNYIKTDGDIPCQLHSFASNFIKCTFIALFFSLSLLLYRRTIMGWCHMQCITRTLNEEMKPIKRFNWTFVYFFLCGVCFPFHQHRVLENINNVEEFICASGNTMAQRENNSLKKAMCHPVLNLKIMFTKECDKKKKRIPKNI